MRLGKALNVKEHLVGPLDAPVMHVGPADLEMHIGIRLVVYIYISICSTGNIYIYIYRLVLYI